MGTVSLLTLGYVGHRACRTLQATSHSIAFYSITDLRSLLIKFFKAKKTIQLYAVPDFGVFAMNETGSQQKLSVIRVNVAS